MNKLIDNILGFMFVLAIGYFFLLVGLFVAGVIGAIATSIVYWGITWSIWETNSNKKRFMEMQEKLKNTF